MYWGEVLSQQPGATQRVAVLFSGGRDSTLAALLCHRDGSYLHLLSFDSGIGYGAELREMRVRELAKVFPPSSYTWLLIPNFGLVRRICFAALADDVREDGCQQLLLGESLAMIARAIVYCLSHGIDVLVSGASGYQTSYGEQRPEAMEVFMNLCDGYGIRFLAPVLAYKSEQAVKDELLEAGLSTKSLEASTILSDLETDSEPEVVTRYLKRKLPVVREFITKFSRL